MNLRRRAGPRPSPKSSRPKASGRAAGPLPTTCCLVFALALRASPPRAPRRKLKNCQSNSKKNVMDTKVQPHSTAWVSFTYAAFLGSVGMLGVGIALLPLDLSAKGYLIMGVVALIQSCITVTKTMRDMHESSRLVNRIEDARTERLLMEAGKNGA